MYGIREIGVKFKDGNKIPGFERDVVGDENVLTAMAATDGDGDEAVTFISLTSVFGEFGFTTAKDDDTGEDAGIGIRADGADAREALIKGLEFIAKALKEMRAEVDD